MARRSMPWFRFYVEMMSDRKIRRLTPAHRWLWVSVLAAARQSPVPGALLVSEGGPMDIEDLADFASLPAKEVASGMAIFEEPRNAMVDQGGPHGSWRVLKWDPRQPESDDVTERTRKHRSNHPPQNNDGTFQKRSKEQPSGVAGNGSGTVDGTMTDLDVDLEVEKDSSSSVLLLRKPSMAERPDEEEMGTTVLITKAIQMLAERDMGATTSTIGNRTAWLAKAFENRRDRHAVAILEIEDFKDFPTAEILAEWLDAPLKPVRPQLPRCEICNNTGWGGIDDKGEAVACVCPRGENRRSPATRALKEATNG
jgi:hypothetical protein